MSKISRVSLLLMVFFTIDKAVALVRQTLIIRLFGFSPSMDAFNVANNLPDLLFSVFSGGALALAFIPVFTEYIEKHGGDLSWKLFSELADIALSARTPDADAAGSMC